MPRKLRPTRAGWCFFAITFGVGFAALNTGNNLLYLVLSLMLAFLALSGFLSELALRGVRIERRMPSELFARAENRVVLVVRNVQAHGAAWTLVVEDRLAGDPAARRRAARRPRVAGRCFVLRVDPGGVERRAYALVPEHRGFVRLEGFRVSTRFPFALFVKSLEIAAPLTALVYPAVEPLSVPPRAGTRADRGETATGIGRDGAQVSALREFVEGDSARRIHWRSSLRRGELLVGEIEDESDADVEVLLRTRIDGPRPGEARAPLADARFEERVAWAASEVVAHSDAGLRVALRTDSHRFSAGAGSAHRARLLSFLATVEPDRPEDEPAAEAHDASERTA
jgi:uncharacterized protein (DUF58 family)